MDETTDYSGALGVLTILLLILPIVSVACRLFTQALVIKNIYFPDYIIVVALALCICQGSLIMSAVNAGFGKDSSLISPEGFTKIQKLIYAASVLNIAIYTSAKLSVTAFVRSLSPVPSHRLFGVILGGVIAAWGLASEFGTIFQCQVPRTWELDGENCINRDGFLISVAVFNITTDLALVIWPCLLVSRRYRATPKQKLALMSTFGTRILVIAAAAGQIALIKIFGLKDDFTESTAPLVICSQVVQSLSIATTCVPYLRPFIVSIHSGVLDADIRRYHVSKDESRARTARSNSSAAIPML